MSEENTDRVVSAQQTFRVLPREILEMTESETACKYCGISYLLLTKVEKMEAHCRQMEAQLENLRIYEKQFPQLQKNVSELQAIQSTLEVSLEEVNAAKRSTDEQLDSIKTIWAHEKLHLKQCQNHLQQSQQENKKLVEKLIEYKELTLHVKRELASIKKDATLVRSQLPDHFNTLIETTMAAALNCTTQHLANVTQTLQEKHGREMVTKVDALEQLSQAHDQLVKDHDELKSSHIATCDAVLKLEEKYAISLQELHIEQGRNGSLAQSIYSQEEKWNQLAEDSRQKMIFLTEKLIEEESKAIEYEKDVTRLSRQKADLMDQVQQMTNTNKSQVSQLQAQLSNQKKIAQDQDALMNEYQMKLKLLDQSKEKNASTLDLLRKSCNKKEEQIESLGKVIKELNSTIQSMQKERSITIESHQTRIKQLQDKFLQDLEAAKASEAEIKLQELQRLHKQNLAILEQQCTEKLKNENSQALLSLQKSWDEINRRCETLKQNEAQATSMKRSLEDRITQLTVQIRDLKATNAADFDRYQARHKELEERLLQANQQKVTPTAHANTEALASALAKKEKELLFLKETVRIECEERMGLISMVANMKREMGVKPSSSQRPASAQPAVATPTNSIDNDGKRVQTLREGQSQVPSGLPGGGLNGSTILVPTISKPHHELAFEAMIKAAAAKKGQKLALGKKRTV